MTHAEPGQPADTPSAEAKKKHAHPSYIGIWVLLLPVWVMSVPQALLAFAVVVAVHLVINVVGFAIGARAAPI